MARPRVVVERPREPLWISAVSSLRPLRSLARRLEGMMEEEIRRAGAGASPYRQAALGVFLFSSSLVPSVLASLLLPFPLSLLFFLLPFILLFLPLLRLKEMAGERKRGTEQELPFFSVYAATLQSAGVSLPKALLLTVGSGIFGWIGRDAQLVRARMGERGGRSALEAMEEVGRDHPHEKMKSFLLGYSTQHREGGDVRRYLEVKTSDLLRDARFAWKRYTEMASSLGTALLSVLFLLPLLLLMAVFLSPGQAVPIVTVFLSAVFPFLLAGIFAVVRAVQPKSFDSFSGPVLPSALSGLLSALACWSLGVEAWGVVVAALLSSSAVYGIPVWLQIRKARGQERELPRFLRDVTERVKMGSPLPKTIVELSREDYGPLNEVIGYVARQLEMTGAFPEGWPEGKEPRSWMVRMVFFQLSTLARYGGGSPVSLELLTEFLDEVVRVRRETRAVMGFFRILSFATPLLLAGVMGVMSGLLLSLSGMGEGIPLELGTAPLEAVGAAVVVAAAAAMGLFTAYVVEFTPKATLGVAANLLLAAVGISAVPSVAGMVVAVG